MTLQETIDCANRAALLGQLLGSIESRRVRREMVMHLKSGGFITPSTAEMLAEIYAAEVEA